MDLAAATAARDRCKKELQEAEREREKIEAEIARFAAKESVTTADVVAHENAVRRLPRLRNDLAESQDALAAAESALAAAQREHDLRELADVRARIAPLREKLDAKMLPLADDPRGAEAAAWDAAHDGAFAKTLHAEIAELQRHLSRWSPGPTLTPGDGGVDPGPWGSFDANATGLPLFQAIRDRVREVHAARETEAAQAALEAAWAAEKLAEEERAAKEQAEKDRAEYAQWMRSPRLREVDGHTRYVYLREQVAWMKRHDRATCDRAKELAEEARADLFRFVAIRTPDLIALVAAFFPDIGERIEAVRLHNAGGPSPVVQHPAHDRDVLDRGTRIEVHHHPLED